MQVNLGGVIVSKHALRLPAVPNREGRFAVVDRHVQHSLAATQQEAMIMTQVKITPRTVSLPGKRKPPAFSRIKKLRFRPNPDVRNLLIEVGAEVQQMLEKKERSARPLENVLRAIVK
jgi:hypothetical protein